MTKKQVAILTLTIGLIALFLGYAGGRAYKTYEINLEKRVTLKNTNTSGVTNNTPDPSAGQKELVDPNVYAPRILKLETTKNPDELSLKITADRFKFSDNTNPEPVVQNAGYANIFVNGNYLGKSFTDTFQIDNAQLQNGTNTISVTLNANNGKTWWSKKGTLEARTNVEVVK